MTSLPQRISNYTLEKRIGKGGSQAEVWLARHTLLENRQVAIKLLLSQDPELIERFSQEAAITARLRHEHIVQIFDHGYSGSHHYTVMEYVPGGSLRELFNKGVRLSLDQSLHILRCAGAALDYAHAHGIVHRDVSPGNILLEPAGQRVLLTDFGIARQTGKAGITTVESVMGTPGYLSPEHATSATAVTHLSDVFSLGVVLYEMLTGSLPWSRIPGGKDNEKIPFSKPRLLKEVGQTQFPSGVDRVLETMMAIDPARRYPTVQVAIEELERVLALHTAATEIIGSAPREKLVGVLAPRTTLQIAQAAELHPVETILGPDLLKGPMLEARRHAEALSQPPELVALLDGWSGQGRLRRPLLGRQAAMHRISHVKVFFYTLRVLYETRAPVKSFEEPDRKAADLPQEKELGRWEVLLPAPRAFVAEDGGTLRLPGSLQVVNCAPCAGNRRVPCERCKGRGRVTVVRETPASATTGKTDTKATTTSAAPTQKSEVVIPCPDCEGTGALKCTACDGVGRMLRHKTTSWNRHPAELRGHDDLPNVDEAWLARTNEPVKIYSERKIGGFRPGWDALPVVGDLIKDANKAINDDTRITMTELSVSFIPMAELVFDLGEHSRGKPPTAKAKTKNAQRVESVVNTYNLHIYGFGRSIPNDWRFLNWDRVWAIILGVVAFVLLIILVIVVIV